MDPSTQLGDHIRRRRRAAKLTQLALADLVGCHRTTIVAIERGRRVPDNVLARRLDEVLHPEEEWGTLVELADRARMHLRAPRLRRPAQLPGAASLVGREDDLARLDAAAADHCGPIVVYGPPGVGTTALAVRWAHRRCWSGGALFLRLHGHVDGIDPASPRDLLGQALSALSNGPIPDSASAREDLLRSLLEDSHTLLLLDDASSEEQVRPLLPGGRRCTVLITSRRMLSGLGIREQAELLPLAPLDVSSGADLLRTRSGRSIVDGSALAKIAGACDGLPLALTAAALHLRSNPSAPSRVLDELTGPRRLQMLTQAAAGDPTAALRTAFEASCARLSPSAREVLAHLARLDRDAVTRNDCAVFPQDVAEAAISELVHGSLLISRGHDQYLLPGLLRLYVRETATEMALPSPARKDVA